MKLEEHKQKLRESLDVIDDSVEKGVLTRQRNIGFNLSAAAVDLLEMMLHKHNLIDPGFVVKHEWFNSDRKLSEKFDFDFPKKKEIFGLMHAIESKRNMLCYGKTQKLEVIQEALHDFQVLRNLFKELGINE